MKSYIKIILSIFVASLGLATLAALISSVLMHTSGDYDIRGITMPYVVAWFGFLIFGISGSLIWFITSKAIQFKVVKNNKRNIISVSMAILICILLFSIIINGLNLNKILKSLWLILLVAPVAVASLITHNYISSREKHNNTVKRD